MLSLAALDGLRTWEATLTDKPAATRRDRFLALSSGAVDRAYRLAGLLLGDATEAEDAVGDAMERAWSRFGQLREPQGFEAWFDRILVNLCRDRLRRRRVVRFIPLEPRHDRPAPGDAFLAVIDRDAVLHPMRDLSSDERLVVVLHFWADLTLAEVATRTGQPIGTVKSRLHRALERMRRTLQPDDAAEVPS